MGKIRFTFSFLLTLLMWGIAGCTPLATITPTVLSPPEIPLPTDLPPSPQSTENLVIVAYVKDGNIMLMDEASDQSHTIFTAGDVTYVTWSDDGQVIAFLRKNTIQLNDYDWYVQFALWVVDRNGKNPQELVSAVGLRARLEAEARESSDFFQIAWIPGTHNLLFSGTKYIVMGEGLSHASPQGVFLVNSKTGVITALVNSDENLRFVLSPGGQQIALMSTTELSFIHLDSGNRRRNVMNYHDASITASLFPTGVWTQDASAFLITCPIQSESTFNLHFTIMRVPIDGSPVEPLATIIDSHPDSVTFSPDGRRVAYYRGPELGWGITPLAINIGPVAIPQHIEIGYASLHWSPAGDAFSGRLDRLCPDATKDTDICSTPFNIETTISAVDWIDHNRLLFLVDNSLYLGKIDGTMTSIVTWRPEEEKGAYSFTIYR